MSTVTSIIISVLYIAWRVWKDHQATADRAAMAAEIKQIQDRLDACPQTLKK